MKVFGFIIYAVLGLFQLAAIMAGLEDWLGFHWIFAFIGGMFLAYIPVIGTIVGIFGAVKIWDWSWLTAIGLFFSPLIISAVCVFGIEIFYRLKN